MLMGRYDTLRQFIREGLICDEFVWNYWARRPRNNHIGDVSDEIEQQRHDAFKDTAKEFQAHADELKHAIEVAHDIDGMDDAMQEFNCDAYDIVPDPTEFDQAVERGDTEAARQELLTGLQKWAKDTLTHAEQDNYDTSPMAHPLNPPGGGGVSRNGKRSMGF